MSISGRARQLFVMGLPEAGKTTYLAALWHVIESQETRGALKLLRLEGNLGYLKHIRNEWVDVRKLERTKVPDETNLLMVLEEDDGEACHLRIPDLSGEAFETQWTDRVASIEYCEWVRASVGGLLFVHPDVREEHLIADVNAIVSAIEPTVASRGSAAAGGARPTVECVEWDPRLAPTQVQLVDLVQFLLVIRGDTPLRLGVIVSAWDKVSDEHRPRLWVERRLPLLYQYLNSHSEVIDVSYFGVSAQGEDFGVPGATERMRACQIPSERIRVCDDRDLGHDITAPIRWLMRGESGRVGSGT